MMEYGCGKRVLCFMASLFIQEYICEGIQHNFCACLARKDRDDLIDFPDKWHVF